MDDLIVLILTLLIGVIGVVGQIRKKKQQSTQEPQEKEPGFWDMFEEKMEAAPQQKPERQIEVEPVAEPAGEKTKPEYEFITENKIKSGKYNKPTINSKQEVPRKKKQKQKFPLRKAVILSEILNRKYV
jgi:hypothetical protein